MKKTAVWLAALLATGCVAALPPKDEPVRKLEAQIDEIVAPYLDTKDFMGVIGWQQHGNTPVIRAYGLASVELSVNHRRSGIFMIGSISKQFTAAAILLLEEDGTLKTTDPVSRHLPDFSYGDAITIEHLLTHTAGVADTYSLASFGTTAGLHGEFATVIKELARAPLTHSPGETFAYSNGGYTLLAAIIEQAAGKPYGKFLEERIFEPLAMTHSSHSNSSPAVPNRVHGYHPWGENELSLQFPQAPAFSTGPGSIWSSAQDLLVWADALHGGRVLTSKSYNKMVQDYGYSYGYGVSIFRRYGHNVVGHDGRVSGFASDLATYIDDQASIVVLSNVESVARDEIRNLVAAAVFGESYTAPAKRSFSREIVDPVALTGDYAFGPSLLVAVRVTDGRLLARANEGAYSELVHTGGRRWFSRMLYTDVCFETDEQGSVDRLVWGCSDESPIGRRLQK